MENGVNRTAKFYKMSRNTVKRWRRRYLEYGRNGLYDKSKKPHNSPKKASNEIISKIKELAINKNKRKCQIKSTKIYRSLHLEESISYVTCNKYVKEAIGKKKRRKEDKTNGGDISWKKKLKPFERVQVDVKYLTDIDSLKPYFKNKNLAKYEFTFRDVSTGFSFVS